MNHYDEEYFKKHNIFGKLTVISLEPTTQDKNGRSRRFCKCLCECGKEIFVERFNLIRNQTKSCGCNRYPKGKSSRKWKSVGNLHASTLGRFKWNANSRHIPFELTLEEGWELYQNQKGLCALSGVPITFNSTSKICDGTASLDRIDSSKGYVKENVQWVHKTINFMKHTLTTEDFLNWCKIIVDRQRDIL